GQKCSATAATVERQERGGLRESLSGRPCVVCLGENLWVLDKRAAFGTHFPPVRFPALQKSRRKIFRSRRRPAIDHGRRYNFASLDFTLISPEVAGNQPSV